MRLSMLIPAERDADARPHHMPFSTSPTIPAARINTGSGIFLGPAEAPSHERDEDRWPVRERPPPRITGPGDGPRGCAVTPSTNASPVGS